MGVFVPRLGSPVNWTPSLTGFSANPASIVSQYSLDGNFCTAVVSMPFNGTSNATTFTITLPFNSKYTMYFIGEGVDNGAAITNMGVVLTGGSNIVTLNKNAMSAGAWTGSGSKRCYFTVRYIIE